MKRCALQPASQSGDGEIRTLDPLLARQVLSQLSYTPIFSGVHLLSHTVASIVPSAACVLTVVFGMGTSVSHRRIGTGNRRRGLRSCSDRSPGPHGAPPLLLPKKSFRIFSLMDSLFDFLPQKSKIRQYGQPLLFSLERR